MSRAAILLLTLIKCNSTSEISFLIAMVREFMSGRSSLEISFSHKPVAHGMLLQIVMSSIFMIWKMRICGRLPSLVAKAIST